MDWNQCGSGTLRCLVCVSIVSGALGSLVLVGVVAGPRSYGNMLPSLGPREGWQWGNACPCPSVCACVPDSLRFDTIVVLCLNGLHSQV